MEHSEDDYLGMYFKPIERINEMVTRRVKKIVVTDELLVELLQRTSYHDIELLDHLPKDATLVHVEQQIRNIELVFESEIFEEITFRHWIEVPAILPRFRRHYPKKGKEFIQVELRHSTIKAMDKDCQEESKYGLGISFSAIVQQALDEYGYHPMKYKVQQLSKVDEPKDLGSFSEYFIDKMEELADPTLDKAVDSTVDDSIRLENEKE